MPTTAAQQAHYQRNRERYIREAAERKRAMAKKLRAIRASQPCADCQNFFPAVCMDFDHRDGEVKVADVSALLKKGNWSAIEAEIAKCDLVCANCHRIRTAERIGAVGED